VGRRGGRIGIGFFCWALACGAGTSSAPPGRGAPGPGTIGEAERAAHAQSVLITSGPGQYWQAGQLARSADAAPDLRVEVTAKLQRWDGFGGTFNEAGWVALGSLPPSERERALRLLFDSRDGASFAYGRIPIGASDFALDRYTLSERADDYQLEAFSIERDRARLIPYVRAALAVNPRLHLWASPWTPPAWMKDKRSTDGGRLRDEPQILATYAQYFARFVQAYRAEGITIDAVQPQNEPGYEQTYPTCLWTPELMTRFIGSYLGPTLSKLDVRAEIWLGTLSAPEDVKHVDAVLGDPAASGYVKGIGVQWNTMNAVPGFVSRYGLPVMQTEHRCGNYPWRKDSFNATRAPNDHAYAEESWTLIASWIRAGVNAYLAWNMVLDTVGMNMDVERPWPQNALLAVDREAQRLIVTPAYHVFRHISQFVEPGAHRLETSGEGDALAFENPDGAVVAIIHNPSDATRAMSLGVRADTLRFEVPAHGWASVAWR
jgi:glucosylceramidase